MINLREKYCVVTFDSTYQSLQFEKLLKQHNYRVRLIPVPRQVSTSCGTAGEVDCKDERAILKLCDENNVKYDEFHCIEKQIKPSWYSQLTKRERV